jgi:hypothetical protein
MSSSLEHEHQIHDDKKLGESNFTTAVEPGHAVGYGEEPEIKGGLKRQLKSRHLAMIRYVTEPLSSRIRADRVVSVVLSELVFSWVPEMPWPMEDPSVFSWDTPLWVPSVTLSWSRSVK